MIILNEHCKYSTNFEKKYTYFQKLYRIGPVGCTVRTIKNGCIVRTLSPEPYVLLILAFKDEEIFSKIGLHFVMILVEMHNLAIY